MKTLHPFFFAFAFISLVVSCKTETKYPNEIASLDSLYAVIDKTEIEFRAIDTAEVTRMLHVAEDHITFLKDILKDDTMNFQSALLISNYHSVLKPFKAFSTNNRAVGEEAVYCKKQIRSLVHDLQKNAAPADSAKQYVASEISAGLQAQRSLEMMRSMVSETMEKFKLYNPRVETLVDSIQKINKP